MPRSRGLLIALTACSLLIVATWAYLPGLHGGFLFDDFINLPALGAEGPVHGWAAFWRYITSGQADPTGRPLALLSFLLDARDWPADPLPFKRTSLLLHLFNGALLTLLLRNLGHALGSVESAALRLRIDLAALLGAGLWLLHPLLLSTTLYIVQREAMLPATFTLLGLLAWLHGRAALLGGRRAAGLAWIALGLGACTVLAVLSKANGLLLPSLALVIEYALLRSSDMGGAATLNHASNDTSTASSPQAYRLAMYVFAWLPTLLTAGYLIQQAIKGFSHGVAGIRPWTLGQRLLTEPRVLMDYLELLWLPRPFTAGLFNDQIQASSSLWSPATTLPALLGVIGLIAGGWLSRRKAPALATALLFYFVGQSLESSTIPLELYFEHRNYLPAMLMFWPLALWLCGIRRGTAPREDEASRPRVRLSLAHPAFGKYRIAFALALVAMLALMTHARAELWGDPHDQALLWARFNPDSPRAQANAAQAEMGAGHPERAVARLRSALQMHPSEPQLTLNLLAAECQQGTVTTATLTAAQASLATSRDPGGLLTSWFEGAIAQAATPTCPQASLDNLQKLLDAAFENQELMEHAGRRQDLYYLRGRIALARGDAAAALSDFDKSLEQEVRAAIALRQAALFGAQGFPGQGLAHLDYYARIRQREQKPAPSMARIHAWVLERQNYWGNELTQLRATLAEDVARQVTQGQ
ncbi:tetratricopeptide repeat protein [Dyella soli]|uniref:Tetratricopeptide repeat protein n=1 Tax=Dyella soli TaxID=522319 RepID=A0A4R0YSC5_9GAMM|nr:tetratricopeptide repeat protein [Dyella soli]TCI10945.1 tetratricopeptide repeat protein [Dyella soli]